MNCECTVKIPEGFIIVACLVKKDSESIQDRYIIRELCEAFLKEFTGLIEFLSLYENPGLTAVTGPDMRILRQFVVYLVGFFKLFGLDILPGQLRLERVNILVRLSSVRWTGSF